MNTRTLLAAVWVILFAVAVSSFFMWLANSDIDSPNEPYTVLKTKYRENYKSCVHRLPRNKDCVIDDVTFKIINIKE